MDNIPTHNGALRDNRVILAANEPLAFSPDEIPRIRHDDLPRDLGTARLRTDPVRPIPNSERRRLIIDHLTWALLPENRNITLIINSCGRLDLLNRTITSFDRYYPSDRYPLYEKIIVDDSRNSEVAHQLIDRYYPEFAIIFTANNGFESSFTQRDQRITFAMDKLYSQVTTPWIYHIEDDWEFLKKGFIDQSFDIFESTISEDDQTGSKWVAPGGRIGLNNTFPDQYRNPHRRGTDYDHFFYNPDQLYSVVLCWNMYREKQWCNRTFLYEYKSAKWYNMEYHFKRGVTWGGFSFNAGLQPTFLYKMYGKFFSPAGEWGKSEQMIRDGFTVALMGPPACDHIGRQRHVDSGELKKIPKGKIDSDSD